MSRYSLKDKVAIVTGASRGIGSAIARKLASEKMKLILNYDPVADSEFDDPVYDLAGYINSYRGLAEPYAMDVSNVDEHDDLINFTLEKYGRIDALINNAGIVTFNDFLDITPSTFDRTHEVNARGPYFLTQKVVKNMVENKVKGNIVFVSSVTSSMFGGEALSHYAGTKASLLAYTRSLSFLSKKYGIRVNAVLPGTHETDVNREDLQKPGTVKGLTKGQEMDQRIPLGLGQPKDVAGLVAFLMSDDAGYITGAQYVVDGGWTTILQ